MSILSVPPASIPRMWHPWRTLRSRPEITVRWHRMDGRLGAWDARSQTIWMHPDQGQAQGRVTATHEQVHAEWGHDGCQPPAVELQVMKETARRHVPIYDLVDAVLFWGESDYEALAQELWCDIQCVRIRLEHLHPAERGYLQQRLAARDGAA